MESLVAGRRLRGGASGQVILLGVSAAPIYLGTSSFTAKGWCGSFYPVGMKSAEYLSFYAECFDTVEIDSTFYACPPARTVSNWALRTPPGFVFSVKVPQSITHEKALVGCETELAEFVEVMSVLGEKLGVMVLQFPFFDKGKIADRHAFTDRLLPFLKNLPAGYKFAIEIRNKKWLDAELADALSQFGVALVLQDLSFMPQPNELQFDPITADFTYIRWLGDRKGIEQVTTKWDKVVEDKTARLSGWVQYCQQVQKRGVKQYIYANNHYEGFGPGTIEKFRNLWFAKGLGQLGKPLKMRQSRTLFDSNLPSSE
jgi:uncharacterized protein YecE (DUF72 family)